MPIYIRKGPLEIPPGSEKDWASEEHEDYFLRDPDQARDSLPQPYRMIAKVVECLIDQAIELIKIREQSREEEKLKKKTDIFQPATEIHVSRRVNCVAAGENGSFLFVGLSEGLMVYSLSGGDWICGWEADKLEVCSLSICHVKNHTYLVGTVDNMGIARLFYFSEENLHFVKAINETEDISKRTVCITFKLSHGGDYAGVLLEGSGECWLEVYKLPKDSWLKELDHAHTTMPSTPIISTESAGTHLSEPKITQPVLLMKIRPPKPITGSTFKSVQEAVQKSDDSSVFGTGQNHAISSHQWEQQEAIFMGMYEKYLSIDVPKIPEGETSRHTMFHILQPNKILHNDSETMQSAVPNSISVHWSGCHNFFIYQLAKSIKDKADVDPKADIVWPCSAPIKFSAVSSCTSYLALALENETLAVWDLKYSGFPLTVVALPEGRHIGSLYHLEHNACSKEPPAATRAQILVWCTDKSLYLVTAAGGREHGTVILLRESTGTSDNQISAVSPIHSLPSMVLLHYWNSTVELFNVSSCEPVCQFGLPSTHMLASPWQPVYSLDTENLSLFLKGTEKVTPGETLSAGNDGCSVFVFSLNTLIKTPKPVGDLSENLPWEQKCKLLLQSRLQTLPERRKQISESWSLLRKQASDLMHRDTLSR